MNLLLTGRFKQNNILQKDMKANLTNQIETEKNLETVSKTKEF